MEGQTLCVGEHRFLLPCNLPNEWRGEQGEAISSWLVLSPQCPDRGSSEPQWNSAIPISVDTITSSPGPGGAGGESRMW